jgi:ferredoxin
VTILDHRAVVAGDECTDCGVCETVCDRRAIRASLVPLLSRTAAERDLLCDVVFESVPLTLIMG